MRRLAARSVSIGPRAGGAPVARRRVLAALLGALLAPRVRAEAAAGDAVRGVTGSIRTTSIASRRTGSTYPIRLYAPPDADAAERLPIVYLVDAEWRLEALVRAAEAQRLRVRMAGIANEGTRNHDDMPAASCAAGAGGEAAFFAFIRAELVPFVEGEVAVDPARRALWGHSYGGGFVLYALFSETPDARTFSAYLAADPSTRCLGATLDAWEAAYAAAHTRLPVRLHYAYANPFNAGFAERIESRHYRDLRFVATAYPGGHDGMIPAAAADALGFAFGPA